MDELEDGRDSELELLLCCPEDLPGAFVGELADVALMVAKTRIEENEGWRHWVEACASGAVRVNQSMVRATSHETASLTGGKCLNPQVGELA